MKRVLNKVMISFLVLFLSMSTLIMCGPDIESMEKRDMVPVPGGTYTQKNYEGGSFSHTISDFSIGKYEVTYELWHVVYKWSIRNGYYFANAGREGRYGIDGADPAYHIKYYPVTSISWRDCIVWCNAYSEMTGLTPVYKYGDSVLKDSRDDNATNCDNVSCDWSADGYRLPTEGEWQFAASDGGKTPHDYASGATASYVNADACREVAWYRDNTGKSIHPVGGKKANVLGLHDMSGNIWEWCWDWYRSWPSGPETDYRGASSGSDRVSRGGSCLDYTPCLQVGYRFYDYSDESSGYNGFRLVRCP